MADLVVGRSEGVSYPNNNLTYRQFIKDSKNFCNKRDCTTCKYGLLFKLDSPCNSCSLNLNKKNNWEVKE